MKEFSMILAFCMLAGWAAGAESTNAVPTDAERTIQRDIGLRDLALVTLTPKRANEIVTGSVTYSGIIVEIFKSQRPWQLLNPAAPVKYSSPEENLVRDPINGQVRGLKFLSIRF